MKQKIHDLLRWSEKYTGTDMIYLTKNGFWVFFGQISSTILVFIASVIFANFLDPIVYGEYKFILSMVAIIGAISLSGIRTTVLNYSARGSKKILGIAFKKNFVWSWPLILISLGISIYYFINGNNVLAIALLGAAIFLPINNSSLIYGPFLSGQKKFKQNTVIWLVGQVILNIGLIGVALTSNSSIKMIVGYFILQAGFNLYAYTKTKKENSVEDTEVLNSKEITSHSLNFSVIDLIGMIASHIDKILVFHFLGAQMTALYAFSIAMPEQIRSAIRVLPRIAVPKFANQDMQEIRSGLSLANKKMIGFFGLVLLITIIYILAAPWLFKTFFPVYVDGVFASQLVAVTLLTSIAAFPLAAMRTHNKHKGLHIHTLSTKILAILIKAGGIVYFGFMGAIWSFIIVQIIHLISVSLTSKIES